MFISQVQVFIDIGNVHPIVVCRVVGQTFDLGPRRLIVITLQRTPVIPFDESHDGIRYQQMPIVQYGDFVPIKEIKMIKSQQMMKG